MRSQMYKQKEQEQNNAIKRANRWQYVAVGAR